MLTPRLGLQTLERIPLCSVAFSRLLHWREISHVTLRGCNSNLVRLRTLRHETFRFSLVSTITHISMFKEFQYTLYTVLRINHCFVSRGDIFLYCQQVTRK